MTRYLQQSLKAAKKIGRMMPGFVQFQLKKLYYPWWIPRFAASAWPPWEGVFKLLPAQAVVIDVGANIGYVTYLLAERVGKQGRVYSIEPVREIYRVLRSNMKRLGMPQVETFNCAASSLDGSGRMAIPDYKEGGRNYYEAHLVTSGDGDDRIESGIRLSRLDTLFKEIEHRIDLIKIDAEGHELAVVEGGLTIIRRDRPILVIESGGDPDDPESPIGRLIGLLKTCGYAPFIFAEHTFLPVGRGTRSVDYFFLTDEYRNRLAMETVT